MNWNDLKIVLAIERGGSLSAAARALGINQTTVSRRLVALEQKLGVTLFLRSRSSFHPTESCEVFLKRAERMESEALALFEEVGAAAQQPQGPVRISTMPWIFNYLVAPALPDFARRYPGISIQAIAGLRERNLGKREAELALRFEMQPHQHELCIPVAKISYSLYAPVNTVAESLPWVGYVNDINFSELQAWQEKSSSRNEALSFQANDAGIVYQVVKAGLGKGLVPDVLAARDPALYRLSGAEPELIRELRILVHEDLQHVARVAAVIDWLKNSVLR